MDNHNLSHKIYCQNYHLSAPHPVANLPIIWSLGTPRSDTRVEVFWIPRFWRPFPITSKGKMVVSRRYGLNGMFHKKLNCLDLGNKRAFRYVYLGGTSSYPFSFNLMFYCNRIEFLFTYTYTCSFRVYVDVYQ